MLDLYNRTAVTVDCSDTAISLGRMCFRIFITEREPTCATRCQTALVSRSLLESVIWIY